MRTLFLALLHLFSVDQAFAQSWVKIGLRSFGQEAQLGLEVVEGVLIVQGAATCGSKIPLKASGPHPKRRMGLAQTGNQTEGCDTAGLGIVRREALYRH